MGEADHIGDRGLHGPPTAMTCLYCDKPVRSGEGIHLKSDDGSEWVIHIDTACWPERYITSNKWLGLFSSA